MNKNKISENTSKLWIVLSDNLEMNIKKLKKTTKFTKKNILLALGWLSKENNLFFWGNKRDLNINVIRY